MTYNVFGGTLNPTLLLLLTGEQAWSFRLCFFVFVFFLTTVIQPVYFQYYWVRCSSLVSTVMSK